ncbi:MAG: polysaccharide biosynthesis tyrosine autokinase [Sphingomonadales bacterium]|nr:polysaccharide biosynthesis tyrosine autokinase [Sphingomonadales bacterium]MDE2168520.1 polysaccharide biosynthesis tyrosine autokinase [Sphingomonadales bacterium]
MPRTFEATTSVLIQPRKVDPTGQEAVVSNLPADTNVVDTQVRLIASPTVALQVVRDLKLASDPYYVPPAVAVQRHASAGAELDKRIAASGASEMEGVALTRLLNDVAVRRSGLTYVIDITAHARSAELSARIANGFAKAYIVFTDQARNNATSAAAGFVQEGAAKLSRQALQDDSALQSYRIAHNLMSADGATLAERQIADLGTQIAEARAALAQERGMNNASQAQVGHGGGADVSAVTSSETIRLLRAQEATASGQLATLQARYGDLHPDVISARKNLADIRRHIAAERDRILAGQRADLQAAQSKLASLESSYNRIQGSLVANNKAMTGMSDLQRKADASAAVYSAFLERAKQTAAQVQSPTPDASIVAAAHEPFVPVWPNIPLAVVFGGIASLTAGSLAVGLGEYLDRTVHGRDEMEALVGINYAGALPDLRNRSRMAPTSYLMARPFSLFAEALRNLLTYIELSCGENARVIAITSSLPGEGKTTAAVCLARMLAISGRRVVLVDGDFRRRSASRLLVPAMTSDGMEVTSVHAHWSQRLVSDVETPLTILPAPIDVRRLTQVSVEDAAEWFAELRRAFDYVIVDTAPVLGLAETRTLARAADAALLVVRWQKTTSRAALAAAMALRECHANLIGGLLSMIDVRYYARTGQADSFAYQKRFSSYYIN